MIDLRFWIKKTPPPKIDETIDFAPILTTNKLGPKKLYRVQELMDKTKPSSERYKNVLVVIPKGMRIKEVLITKEKEG